MLENEALFDLAFNSFRKIIFPEEWLKLDKALAKQDLLTLMFLDRLGECTMSQIAEQMNFPLSTTTGIVDRLVKKGYAERMRSESDRRLILILISAEGRSLVGSLKAHFNKLLAKLSQLLDADEQAVLLKLIAKLGTILESVFEEDQASKEETDRVMKIHID